MTIFGLAQITLMAPHTARNITPRTGKAKADGFIEGGKIIGQTSQRAAFRSRITCSI